MRYHRALLTYCIHLERLLNCGGTAEEAKFMIGDAADVLEIRVVEGLVETWN